MKRTLIYLFVMLAIVACRNQDEEIVETPKTSELIVGEWVYDDPVNGIWEEQKLLSNGKLYFSAFYLNPYVWMENADGTYYFSGDDTTMTLAYPTIIGGTTYSDVQIEHIDKYTYTGRFSNSDGSFGGRYVYHRVVDRVEVELGGSIVPKYSDVIVDSEIQGYSANDESLIEVNAVTGEVKAKGKIGQTYVCIHTPNGGAYVEVIVYDPDNLFPDYSSALNMNQMEVQDKWGNYNKEYANAMRYPIRGNEYAKLVTIFLDDNKDVEGVQVELKTPVSISTTEKEIHQYLSSKYEYQSVEDGVYLYFDLSQPEVLPMAIFYEPSSNLIEYIKVSKPVEDLWPDYTLAFGKTVAEISTEYGSPFYETNTSAYYFQENDYVDFVSFSISSTTGTIYASSLFLKQDCDWQAALDYLNNKYYYYELGSTPDENRFAFTNKPSLSDSNIGITFDGVNGAITYVDLKASRGEVGKMAKNEFPVIKVRKPNL